VQHAKDAVAPRAQHATAAAASSSSGGAVVRVISGGVTSRHRALFACCAHRMAAPGARRGALLWRRAGRRGGRGGGGWDGWRWWLAAAGGGSSRSDVAHGAAVPHLTRQMCQQSQAYPRPRVAPRVAGRVRRVPTHGGCDTWACHERRKWPCSCKGGGGIM
jgi:hypothetical protein